MPDQEWFYARGGVQTGPVPATVLRQLIATGQIARSDPIWCEGMNAWQAAGELAELFPPMTPPPVHLTYVAPRYLNPAPAIGKSYNGLAIAGFVTALIPAVTLLGLIFSAVALSGMKRTGNFEGKGFATAGLVISIVYLSLGRLYFAAVFSCLGGFLR